MVAGRQHKSAYLRRYGNGRAIRQSDGFHTVSICCIDACVHIQARLMIRFMLLCSMVEPLLARVAAAFSRYVMSQVLTSP